MLPAGVNIKATRMAQLREIRVSETRLTYSNKRDWFFHPSAHHVRELLLHFLPSGFVLDGSSVVSVICGKKREGDLQWHQVLGITFYYVEAFDIPAYMALPHDAKQDCILSTVTAALVTIAERAGSDAAAIVHAAQCVRDCGFAVRIPVKKLWRSTPDRQFRIEVYRCLGTQIGEVWEAHVFDKSHTLLGVDYLTPRRSHAERTTHFSKSRWDGDIYEVTYSRDGSVMYRLDLGPARRGVPFPQHDEAEAVPARSKRLHGKLP
jgi:hypothetical protein